MAVTYKKSGEIIIDGIANGIADNPYDGIADMRNINIVSIPKEGNLNFSMTKVSSGTSPAMGKSMYSCTSILAGNFIVDNNGYVWGDRTNSGTYTYQGNTPEGSGFSTGNGIACFEDRINNYSYIFVFSANKIDYAKVDGIGNITWFYGWNPADGSSTGTINIFKVNTTGANHSTCVYTDGTLYFCDGNWIGQLAKNNTNPSTAFDPSNTSTYIYSENPVIPQNDTATCLQYLGSTLLIGGSRNIIYPWDRTITITGQTLQALYETPIVLAEVGIYNMITVNTNTYVFAGNRGRIYITNGSRADLYKKIPDHITGTVEPYYQWGGAVSIKNQLYFSFLTTTNSGTPITTCGGIWAIDLSSQNYNFASGSTLPTSLRMSNQLSYGTYNGYASVLTTSITNNGAGLLAGWSDGAGSYGIDVGQSVLYGTGTIDFDLIPIGTYFNPTTGGTIEFKVSQPTIADNQIKLQYRQDFNSAFQDLDSSKVIPAGSISGAYESVTFEKSQWLQLRAVLTGGTNAFGHLTEIRINP